MKRRPKTARRNPSTQGVSHSIIVRYDYDSGRWIHSAGIIITPREAVVLEALANGHSPSNMAEGAGVSVATFYAVQGRLKNYFGIPGKDPAGHHKLLKIAMDLYGDPNCVRGARERPAGRAEPRAARGNEMEL